jgi:hypothetical protein
MALLGAGITRHFPIQDDSLFDGLLAHIDEVTVELLGKSVVLRPERGTGRT